MADKGVIIEFDFAAMNGAELLYKTARDYFSKVDDITINPMLEARFLAGKNYEAGIGEMLAFLQSKKTAQKAAKELPVAFAKTLLVSIPDAVTPGFKAVVKALEEKGLKVIITTRADVDRVAPAFEGVLDDNVKLYHENSITYGNVKWDAWKRAARANGSPLSLTCAITGSGFGVKSALLAGLSAVGVVTPHTDWQDFGGADHVATGLDASVVPFVLRALKVH